MKINSKNSIRIMLFTTALALVGCGGGGGSGSGSGSGSGTIPLADAGIAIEGSRNATVSLDGSASSDPEGDALTYTWTQTKGPDVTGGIGMLTGVSPSFTADSVDTLIFELVVNDGTANSAADTVIVNVFEDLTAAFFVDGDSGDDTRGTGSRTNPFATLGGAMAALTASHEDIYVKTTTTAYVETAVNLDIPSGTSLYGGYDVNWMRNVAANKTVVNVNHRGVQFPNVTLDAWFSGFNLATSDSPAATEDVFGVFGSGNNSASLHVLDNIISTGDVQTGVDSTPGSNYGVALRFLVLAEVGNNIITTGAAGNGLNGTTGVVGADGDNGSNGNQTGGRRAPGGSGGPGANGGTGGTRGGGLSGSGGNGVAGGTGTAPLGGTISGGGRGAGGVTQTSVAGGGGSGDPGGRGTPGNAGNGAGSLTGSLFTTSNGNTGGRGGHGAGGGGGGGGAANSVGVVGGGGGGGGEGGEGGFGGSSGRGGAASIGVWLHDIVTSDVKANTISSGTGGSGASGGSGGSGGAGGSGGNGSAGDDLGVLGKGGSGGGGGNGGSGGTGGTAGAGGGGPSYGIIFAAGMAPTLTANTITSGNGGPAGNGGLRGNGSEGGYSFAIFDRDPNDGFFATLDQNILTFGMPGNGGSSGGLNTASAGSDGQTGARNW